MAAGKKELKFEDAIKRLEEIVKQMEGGELSLEESIKVFQEGMELAGYCNKKLDEAETKINVIAKGLQGEMIEEDFTPREE